MQVTVFHSKPIMFPVGTLITCMRIKYQDVDQCPDELDDMVGQETSYTPRTAPPQTTRNPVAAAKEVAQ